MKLITVAWIVSTCFSWFACEARGEVFKCRSEDGGLTYTDQPCGNRTSPPQTRPRTASPSPVSPRLSLEDALSVFEGGDYVRAFDLFKQVESGDPYTSHVVGILYESGIGTTKDLARAMAQYVKAYDRGYSPSAISIIRMYQWGLGVEANGAKVQEWTVKSGRTYNRSESHSARELRFVVALRNALAGGTTAKQRAEALLSADKNPPPLPPDGADLGPTPRLPPAFSDAEVPPGSARRMQIDRCSAFDAAMTEAETRLERDKKNAAQHSTEVRRWHLKLKQYGCAKLHY